MAAKKKKKKHTAQALVVVPKQLPVDVTRDTNHLAENSKSGERLRTEKELKHDAKIRKIESDERVALYERRTVRIRNYLLFALGTIGMSIGEYRSGFVGNLFKLISKKFFGS